MRKRTHQGAKKGRSHPSSGRPFKRSFGRREAPDGAENTILYGWHTVQAALDTPGRRIRALYATENAARRLAEESVRMTVTPQIVRPDEIARRLSADAVHNGLLAEADPLAPPDLSDLAPEGVVLVLDQITDPHNVGAILRTACAFGADAVITTARHSPRETGVMAKSASGALDLVPMIEVRNLGDALEKLKARGMLVLGFDSESEHQLKPRNGDRPLAIVMGAEGKGLRQRTRELCDEMVKLDMPGPIKSLNVSNAAAIALFAATAGRV